MVVCDVRQHLFNEEKRWADYLFQNGSMIGLNDTLLKKYVEWVANRRMKAMTVSNLYMMLPQRTIHFLGHNTWISSKGLQVFHKKRK